MHQVSVAALYTLLKKAYDRHTNQDNDDETPALQFSNWLNKLWEEQP